MLLNMNGNNPAVCIKFLFPYQEIYEILKFNLIKIFKITRTVFLMLTTIDSDLLSLCTRSTDFPLL